MSLYYNLVFRTSHLVSGRGEVLGTRLALLIQLNNFDCFSQESTNCRAPTYCRNQWNQCPGRVVVRDAIITSVVIPPWKSMISLIGVKYKLMSHLASPLLQPHLLRILFWEEFYSIFFRVAVAIENQINFKSYQRCFVNGISRKRKPLIVPKTQKTGKPRQLSVSITIKAQ